jgi:predicted pyridoxine 5'-phosphate oxidase superfamily flavin-nucleotide-binding protein
MPGRYHATGYTDSVRAAQARYGTRWQADRMAAGERADDRFGPDEAAFIAARDGFYLATVNQDGWPYVQYRGGPRGFLKVLDETTLGYADFRGNLQYLTVGNIGHDDRVALFLMDYANRRRLKIWARARIVDAADDPALVARLAHPGYDATVERAVVMRLRAFDWNCAQHITPRFTEAEIAAAARPLLARIAELEQRLAAGDKNAAAQKAMPEPLSEPGAAR